MIRKYELVYIMDSSLSDENRNAILEKIGNIIKRDAELIDQQNLGEKGLAYPIKKKQKGIYIKDVFKGMQSTVKEIERTLKITEGILRYLTVRVEQTS